MDNNIQPIQANPVSGSNYSNSSFGAIDTRVRNFGYVLLASALMSFIPKINIGTGIFGLVFVYFIFHSFIVGGIKVSGARAKICLAFLIYCVISLYVLVTSGFGLPEWSRAVVPFLFFFSLFLLPKLSDSERRWLASMLFKASMLWAAKIMAETAILVLQGSDVLSVRLTFRVIDSVLPFPLVAVPYLLFVKTDLKPYFKWVLLFMMIYLYVWIGYRGGLALLASAILLFTFVNFRRFGILQVLLMFGLVFALVSVGAFDSFSLLERFDSLAVERDGSRAAEWTYAMAQFAASPLVGWGLGWPVPADIAFLGVEDADGTQAASVGFVHSVFAYLAMDLGVIGILLYFGFIFPRMPGKSTDDLVFFSSVTIILLLLFCNTQAAFRQIQTVLMIVTLLKINDQPNVKGLGRQQIPCAS